VSRFLTSAANVSPLIIKFQTCRVRLANPGFAAPEKIKKNDHRALVIISSTGIAIAARENGEQAVQNERVKSSDMKIDNGIRIIDDMHSCQLVARPCILFQIVVPPPVLSTCIYHEKVTQHSFQEQQQNTIRVMCLTYLHVETAPSNQLGNPLNHTAQTSRLRPQRRGSLLLRQPSKQASKSRLPPLKHSLESRASKPVQRSQSTFNNSQ
jgi:hypothetical protein